MANLNYLRGWNRVFVVGFILWAVFILLYFPFKTGSELRGLAVASYERSFGLPPAEFEAERAEFSRAFKEASIQVQLPLWLKELWNDPFESFLGFMVIPAVFYVIPILIFFLIRWLVRGFRGKEEASKSA